MNPTPRLLLPLVALLLSCTDAPHTTLPVAACGMEPYTLLDPATLGEVVSHDEIHPLALDAEAVNALLKQAGYTALLPVPHGSRVHRFRYTTQDRGRKIEATALLAIPYGPDVPLEPLPVSLFLHGTTGFADACAPSADFGMQAGAALVASLGFIAILPDYIGLNGFGGASTSKHGWLVGEQVAIGSWDAVRAGLKLLPTLGLSVDASNRVVPWGASQGGHAALFAELYAPYYAPEYEIPAVVAMVAPSALAPLAQIGVSDFTQPTIAFAAALASMRSWYGKPGGYAGVLSDAEPYRFASTIDDQIFVKEECNTAEAYDPIKDHPEHQRPETVYDPAFIAKAKAGEWDALSPWGCYLQENSLATSSVKPQRFTPTFMPYAEKDELIVTAPMRDEFDRLCRAGYRLQYLECAKGDHVEGALWSLPEQVRWIRDRLSGKPFSDVCQRHPPVCCKGTPADRCTP